MSLSVNTNAAPVVALQLPPSTSADARDSSNASSAGAAAAEAATPTQTAAYSISTSASAQSTSDLGGVAGVQPDIDGDGARLMALSIQQALGSGSSSIANASSQSILTLFKG